MNFLKFFTVEELVRAHRVLDHAAVVVGSQVPLLGGLEAAVNICEAHRPLTGRVTVQIRLLEASAALAGDDEETRQLHRTLERNVNYELVVVLGCYTEPLVLGYPLVKPFRNHLASVLVVSLVVQCLDLVEDRRLIEPHGLSETENGWLVLAVAPGPVLTRHVWICFFLRLTVVIVNALP